HVSRHHTILFKPPEPRCQHLGSYSADVGSQLAEPSRSLSEIPKDVGGPGPPDDRHARRQRADLGWRLGPISSARYHRLSPSVSEWKPHSEVSSEYHVDYNQPRCGHLRGSNPGLSARNVPCFSTTCSAW